MSYQAYTHTIPHELEWKELIESRGYLFFYIV